VRGAGDQPLHDRDGLVTMLNGMAEPPYGIFKRRTSIRGADQRYGYDPTGRGHCCARRATDPTGGAHAVMIHLRLRADVPLPMNEFLQRGCGPAASTFLRGWERGTCGGAAQRTDRSQAMGVDALK